MARWQLLEVGVTSTMIQSRLAKGLLHRRHQGVYLVGQPRPTLRGAWMAAVLACGPEAVLSHRSAAMLWGLYETSRARIEVTAPTRRERCAGVQPHAADVPPDERDVRDGIPVTGIHRTLLDLAAVAPQRLERALATAEAHRLTDRTSLPGLLERYPRRSGSPRLRALLDTGAERTRSELEARFLRFARRAGLPRGEANGVVWADGVPYEIDYLWRHVRVGVELDGRAHHADLASFESDRSRDRALQAGGYRIVRVTARQLRHEPEAVARDLRRLVAAAVPST